MEVAGTNLHLMEVAGTNLYLMEVAGTKPSFNGSRWYKTFI